MGEGDEWSVKEAGDLALRVLPILCLLLFLSAVIFFLTRSSTKDQSVVDFENIVSELKDLRPGETIKVPVLSAGHSFILRPIAQVAQLGLNCNVDEGDFCACLKKDDSIISCKSLFILGADISKVELLSSGSEVQIDKNNGITLTYGEGTISIS